MPRGSGGRRPLRADRSGSKPRPAAATGKATRAPATLGDAGADANAEAEPTIPRGSSRTRSTQPQGPTLAPTRPARGSGSGGDSTRAGTGLRLTHQICCISTFEAKYRIGEELGRGGMGLVRQAEDSALRRELALKVLLDTGDEEALAGFVDEAQITGQLEHPNIIPVYDLGVDPSDRPYMAMKLVRGQNLSQMVRSLKKRNRRSTAAELQSDGRLSVFAKVCDALAYAHNRGVIHRDLKPDNVMVGEFGEVLVMDWGLAKPVGSLPTQRKAAARAVHTTRREGGHTTLADEVFGTPAFMAPEQAQGDVMAVDERSDIFSLGGILYSLLTFEVPYTGRNVHDVLANAASYRLVAPRRRAPAAGIPKELDAVVMKAMAEHPADRYASVQDLAADITAYLSHEPMLAWRDGMAARAAKWVRRHPAGAMTGGVSLVFVCLIAALLSLWMAQSEAQQREVQRLALERVESDAARVKAEQESRDAELRRLVQARQFDQMAEVLGAKVKRQRDEALQRFSTDLANRPPDMTIDAWFASWAPGRLEETIAAFERVLQAGDAADQQFHEAADFFFLGAMYSDGKHDWQAAIRWYDRALEMDPQHFGALGNRGFCKQKLGRAAEGLVDIDAALALAPNDAMLHMMRAQVLRELGRVDESRDELDTAIRLAPKVAGFRQNRGLLRMEAEDFAGAVEDFTAFLQSAPHNAEVLYTRSRCLRRINRPSAADSDLDLAISINPDLVAARVERGNLRVNAGQMTEAGVDFDAALRIEPDNISGLVGRAVVRFAAGNAAGALADLDRAVAQAPDYVPAIRNRARMREEAGNLQGAMADFTIVLDLAPDDREARVYRGHIHGRLQQIPEAIADFTRVIESQPQDATTGDAYFQRSIANRMQGNREASDRDAAEAVRLAPNHARAHLAYGIVLAQRNDADGALAALNRAIELDPDDYRAWFNRASILDYKGDRAGAIRDLQQAWRLAPDARIRQQIEQALRDLGGRTPD